MEVRFRIQDVKKHNEEVIRQEKRNLNVELCECLYISEYIYAVTEDKIYIAYMTFNENKLIQVLSYYNRNNGDGVALSVEDVMKEYDNFCNNTGSYDRLLALNEFCKDDVNKDLLEQYRVSMGDFYKKEYDFEAVEYGDTAAYLGDLFVLNNNGRAIVVQVPWSMSEGNWQRDENSPPAITTLEELEKYLVIEYLDLPGAEE